MSAANRRPSGKSHLCKQELTAGIKKEAESTADSAVAPQSAQQTKTLPHNNQLFGQLTDIKVTTDMLRDRIANLESLLVSTLQGKSTEPSLEFQPLPLSPLLPDLPQSIGLLQSDYAFESLRSSKAPSLSSAGGEEGRQAEQELEASVALEFLALGRHRNFDTTSTNSPQQALRSHDPAQEIGYARRRLTSIRKDATQQIPPMPLLQYPTLESLAAAFPERKIAEPIIMHSVNALGWHHGALHAPTFKRELSEFWSINDEERISLVDPSWLAIVFAVLVVGVANWHPVLDAYISFSNEEQNSLAKKWFDCSMVCLHRANFMQNHSLYSLQAIAILVVSGQDAAGPNLIPTLLTAGISSAQELGLHRMCSDTEWDLTTTNDPADVRVESLIKREMCKRVFWTLCTQDWFGTAYRKTYMVQPTQVTTPLPCNMRDEDLLLGQVMNRPVGQYTVVSKLLLWIQIARCLQSTFEHLDTHAGSPSYEFLLQVDERLSQILERAPAWLHPNGPTDGMPACIDWVRSTFVISSNHKVLTLHRPFLHRAFQDPRYQSSRRRAITASRTILREAARCGDDLFRLWTIPYHISAAACVVLLDLFQRSSTASASTLMVLEAGGDKADDMRDEVKGALKALQGMQETSAVASRGASLVANLMLEEEKLRSARAGLGLSPIGLSSERGVKRPATTPLSSSLHGKRYDSKKFTARSAHWPGSAVATPGSEQSHSPQPSQSANVPLYSPVGLDLPQEFLNTFTSSGSDWGLGFPGGLNTLESAQLPAYSYQVSMSNDGPAALTDDLSTSFSGADAGVRREHGGWTVPLQTNGIAQVPWIA
ncbi:hypothetical protein OIV83_005192 [Microbotryomycetes sp. JL201]|nr:hypothetical protein OIV83_005192 [Microbotryomycetes sp. JL201]